MSACGPYAVHPVAELFPLLDDEEFLLLVADIRERGLQESLVLTSDGKTLVDGRNRFLACDQALVDPHFKKLPAAYSEEQIADFIVAANLRRRHLDNGQRSMLAVEIEKFYAGPAKERQREHAGTAPGRPKSLPQNSGEVTRDRESSRRAAKAVGVSHDSISRAKKVASREPELARQVKAGTRSLNDAYKETQRREKAEPERQRPTKPTPVMLTLRTHEGVEVPYPKPQGKSQFNPTNDHISWAAWSWNPVTGCLHGCEYCYARELATKASYAGSYPVGFTPVFHHERLDAPADTPVPSDAAMDPRRKRVFVCSMADLYGKWVPQEWIDQVHAACVANPQWDYLFLTKFPSRYVKLKLPPTAWIGTSVDSQRRVTIAEEAFRKIDHVRVKWLSLEPLLEPLAFSDLSMFDWVVVGAQTQTFQPDRGRVPAFAPEFDWVRSVVDQARAAGCAVYLKPNLMGEVNPNSPGMRLPQEVPFSHP